MSENRDNENNRGSSGNGSPHGKARRGKRKADVVRPGPLYRMADTLVTIAGLALIGAIIVFVLMIFG